MSRLDVSTRRACDARPDTYQQDVLDHQWGCGGAFAHECVLESVLAHHYRCKCVFDSYRCNCAAPLAIPSVKIASAGLTALAG
jgi:hypothetical protein